LSIRASLLALLLCLVPVTAMAQTVFAAASLTDSMKQLAELYRTRTGRTVTLSFGASSTLARQIEQGAPADIFFSADADWMDYLARGGHIAAGSRKNLLGNQLVMIAAPDAPPAPRIAPRFDLKGALGDGHLALADPASVPAGKYGKAALTALGVWAAVAPKVVHAENVRVALEYVARSEAPYGIVYATDARVAPRVKLVGVFPESSHPPIIYPVALTSTASPGARDFLTFLSSSAARTVFEKAGFNLR
jgi:molybdate transport system substrate-binding protein